MKKFLVNSLALFLSFVMIFGASPILGIDFSTQASALTEGIYTYDVTDNEATITDCDTNASGVITIPSSLGGYPVTRIGDNAFQDCTSLTSISIPEGVKSINFCAFLACSSLASVTIPESVTNIGAYAFTNCSSLANINIPVSVTSIELYTFTNCTSLVNITIPESVTQIGERAFAGCSSLNSINIPESVTRLGPDFLQGTAYINDVTNWTGYVLFIDNCLISAKPTSLSGSYVIPAGTRLIADSAFSGCISLTGVLIPTSLTSIAAYAFYNCSSLTSVSIPTSVTSIGDRAFYGCSSLQFVHIPSSVTTIGVDILFSTAADICSTTEECYASTYADDYGHTFVICSGHSIKITDGIYTYEVMGNEAMITACDTSASGAITIPSTIAGYPVTVIGESAFNACTLLTSVTIPASVTRMGETPFLNCTLLASVTFESGSQLTSINYRAFSGCSALTSIDIPESVTSIISGAFENCTSLTSINIPEGVTIIEYGVFNGCTSLASITIPTSVTDLGTEVFLNTAYYNTAANWTGDVLYIGNCLIQAKDTLSGSYVITTGTRLIAEQAFYDCSSLLGVTIPEGVTIIGYGAFQGCTSLASISIPTSVTNIGYSAFANTAYYNDTTKWTDDVLYIGNCLIEAKDTISGSYSITAGTRLIAGDAFYNCTLLSGVAIPESVTSIGSYAFGSCSALTSINIPTGVTSIGENAFYGCTVLEYVHIPSSVTTIGKDLLYDSPAYICSDTEDCYAKEYSLANEIQFLLCAEHCPVCGASWDFEYTIDTPATCTVDGSTSIHCSVCEETKDVTAIPATGHTKVIDVPAVAATCTAAGNTESSHCSVCAAVISSQTVVPATGHTYGVWTVVTPATVSSTGVERRDCTACDHYETRVIAKLCVASIQSPSITKINYGDTLILHANLANGPAGSKIEWSVEGSGVEINPSADGTTCDVTSTASGAVTITAKVVDANGDPILVGGNEITATQSLTSKAGFFQKLISFFKTLFGANRIISQAFKQFI